MMILLFSWLAVLVGGKLVDGLSGQSARRFLLTDFTDHTDEFRCLTPDP